MTDESDKPAVTDSRFPGFNPEVEESKAAAEKAAAEKAAGETAAPAAKPAAPRKPYEVMVAFMHAVANQLGNHPELKALLDELDQAL